MRERVRGRERERGRWRQRGGSLTLQYSLIFSFLFSATVRTLLRPSNFFPVGENVWEGLKWRGGGGGRGGEGRGGGRGGEGKGGGRGGEGKGGEEEEREGEGGREGEGRGGRRKR